VKSRRSLIEARLEQDGQRGAAAAQFASIQTREVKSHSSTMTTSPTICSPEACSLASAYPADNSPNQSCISTWPGQFVAVAFTWLTYVFPHDDWFHVGSNALGLFVLGGALERLIGRRRFALLCLAAAISGAFALALVSPNDRVAIGGGSLVLSPMLGVFLAMIFSRAWEPRPTAILGIEMVLTGAFALWLALRTIPTTRDFTQAAMWHAIPIFIGWVSYRWTCEMVNWTSGAALAP
jgi:membrane associated rhomboid family serine protease